jgi:hypothetical protein
LCVKTREKENGEGSRRIDRKEEKYDHLSAPSRMG